MIIIVDVDDVTASLVPAWIDKYNRDWNDNVDVSDITDWNIAAFVKPECGTQIYGYLNDGSLYDAVVPVHGAAEGIADLRKYHRVVFVTTAVNGHAGRKLRWLRQYGFLSDDRDSDKDYIEAADKSLIRGDVIIDDRPQNLRTFVGKRIQFLRPWNEKEFVDGAYLTKGWKDIPAIIQRIANES